ncbi:hypothetical protein SISNIDRAFT_506319 [Sistotremastrum niveocremeum HHB9708]|uniref:Uncharacterized protein n=1 Tax=Sistotremastrum niveocremeum HHB9708 TaxID=1314777 RepID=A0A164V3X7_9AGAM|nr:hypothetical protein SISNIDRAFT_506319 [Sistotremastrum niveocremeum HHB9708]
MKFTISSVAVLASFTLTASAWPVNQKRDVDPALVPPFGVTAGVNPDGTGNCDGIDGSNGKPILIPCACPPSESDFLASLNANVDAGFAVHNPTVKVSFPTDNSKASQLARIETCIVTLQNLHGPGQGCPASSTTFSAQQKAIQDGTAPPPPVSAPAASSPAPAPAAAKATSTPASSSNNSGGTSGGIPNSLIASLAPPLGFHSGVNPTGTGDCDGAVNGSDGKPIKVPCACPPSQDDYISSLEANIAAGEAVHNPGVKVTFPTDDSKQSQAARVEAAIVTLQNLHGPGQGCPVVSTTLGEQQKALQS